MQQHEVEHSTDGTHFSIIATINALNISNYGYSVLDDNPATGNNYYRILSLDKDEKTT